MSSFASKKASANSPMASNMSPMLVHVSVLEGWSSPKALLINLEACLKHTKSFLIFTLGLSLGWSSPPTIFSKTTSAFVCKTKAFPKVTHVLKYQANFIIVCVVGRKQGIVGPNQLLPHGGLAPVSIQWYWRHSKWNFVKNSNDEAFLQNGDQGRECHKFPQQHQWPK